LVIASAGFLAWLPEGLDPAINVAVSLLVVTCPCAIGIAIPLAYEMTQAHLRRRGFFIRSADLLDRLTRIQKVHFDKTGTLTLGRLELNELPSLDSTAQHLAYNLAIRSSHHGSSSSSTDPWCLRCSRCWQC
jgi:Cu2+-exporting ATPase